MLLGSNLFAVTQASPGSSVSALVRARALAAALPDRRNATTSGGEVEDHEFWVQHEKLFQEAREEYGVLHASLYDLEGHVEDFIDARILRAVIQCEKAAKDGEEVDETAVRQILQPSKVPNVWRLPLFTSEFCRLLLAEYQHLEASGIPLRRPNGMK